MIKSKDVAVLILVGGIIALLSFLISNRLFSSKDALRTQVEVIEPINPDFSYTEKSYFGPNALNPTRDITISENNNPAVLTQ